MAFAT
eukprot:symbB.v1.2.041676.t1/scaffold8487.1/size6122/1